MTKEEFRAHIEDVLNKFQTVYPGCIDSIIKIKYVDCCPEERWAEMEYTVEESGANILGMAHGGAVAWIMDNCSSLTVAAYIKNNRINTINMNINYLSGTLIGDRLLIRAHVDRVGSTICSARTEIYCKDKLCYTADTLHYILKN